jgi:hypothetical protein
MFWRVVKTIVFGDEMFAFAFVFDLIDVLTFIQHLNTKEVVLHQRPYTRSRSTGLDTVLDLIAANDLIDVLTVTSNEMKDFFSVVYCLLSNISSQVLFCCG